MIREKRKYALMIQSLRARAARSRGLLANARAWELRSKNTPFFQQRVPDILVHGRLDEVFVLRVAQRAVLRLPPPRRALVPHGVERVHRLDRLDRRLAVLDHVVHEQVLVRRGPRAPRTTCPAWTTTPLDLMSHGDCCNTLALIAVVDTSPLLVRYRSLSFKLQSSGTNGCRNTSTIFSICVPNAACPARTLAPQRSACRRSRSERSRSSRCSRGSPGPCRAALRRRCVRGSCRTRPRIECRTRTK